MSTLALRAEDLGKRYRLGARDSHRTFRDLVSHGARQAARRVGAALRGSDKASAASPLIWALKDVSFEIERGEAVGIIGENGAGKTTLLKILSRVTEPTRGRVTGYGRVSSLLEVGTGFHPELTGRENIFLNGAILGMKRPEILTKFDAIVAFSGVDRFLDTPIKHYSSGMHVRLAFAVAAHLDPEILVVDEALAVGDAAFQKRCVEKMGEMRKGGRTVLFVSHNLGLIQSLCDRTLLLRRGTVVVDDRSDTVVAAYLQELEESASRDLLAREDRRGTGAAMLESIAISGGTPGARIVSGKPARFLIRATRAVRGMTCSFTIYDQMGWPVTFFDTAARGDEDAATVGRHGFMCTVDELTLVPGRYRINAELAAGGTVVDHVEAAAFFDVEHGTLQGRPAPRSASHGHILLRHRWTDAR